LLLLSLLFLLLLDLAQVFKFPLLLCQLLIQLVFRVNVLLLKDMFDPNVEVGGLCIFKQFSVHILVAAYFLNDIPLLQTEPDFDLDIKEDVQEECSKFGKLKHIFVEK
jgi:hypothetical protein